ncbi:MAG: NnrU family protein [Hirschia sp.]|nr:NnrU family protein [Hirschia sp.]MBF20028.1 NnrU family protein [Hirschia sp.]|tara:strand:- start:455 stop:1042 length:588 start_codon:yes stop_codon:yes gene_type:complete
MSYLYLGIVLFFTAHVVAAMRSRGPGNLREKIGYGPYMGLFSLVSGSGLALMIWGYGQARIDPTNILFWTSPEWTRHIVLAIMPISLILLVSAYVPTGHIKKCVKHPMLAAVKIWAAAHLIYNGDLASVLLFGSFLAYAVFSRIMAKRRGDNGPAISKASVKGDLIAIILGLGFYVVTVLWLHTLLIGVPAVVHG